jgi:hypothetical protein
MNVARSKTTRPDAHAYPRASTKRLENLGDDLESPEGRRVAAPAAHFREISGPSRRRPAARDPRLAKQQHGSGTRCPAPRCRTHVAVRGAEDATTRGGRGPSRARKFELLQVDGLRWLTSPAPTWREAVDLPAGSAAPGPPRRRCRRRPADRVPRGVHTWFMASRSGRGRPHRASNTAVVDVSPARRIAGIARMF